ncbi:hypothetical protein GWI33_020715 [Rhynchophorus ferrugineus]|uniref:Uncharacterized protein n=1 Tax=Rhynchophorus ferrugineus TaxID=354439 RepID=A0A834M5M6_RHYFE|nr:hypothetical protein GWI33_020715 [Rhynchophorus ferrugineus]
MATLKDIHSVFVKELVESSKLIPHAACSAIPSVLFLVSVFLLLHIRFHQYENLFTTWYSRLYKELLFHWTYFYTTRLWFLFLKLSKWFIRSRDGISSENIYYFNANKYVLPFVIFFLVLAVSLIPCLILFIKYLNRVVIPNFFLGVGIEDPWTHSEIGTAGHYLERPPPPNHFYPYNKHNVSYRSKRSSSVDTNVYLFKQPFSSRTSRSAEELLD